MCPLILLLQLPFKVTVQYIAEKRNSVFSHSFTQLLRIVRALAGQVRDQGEKVSRLNGGVLEVNLRQRTLWQSQQLVEVTYNK